MEFQDNRIIVPANISIEELAEIINKYSDKYTICIDVSDKNTNSGG